MSEVIYPAFGIDGISHVRVVNKTRVRLYSRIALKDGELCITIETDAPTFNALGSNVSAQNSATKIPSHLQLGMDSLLSELKERGLAMGDPVPLAMPKLSVQECAERPCTMHVILSDARELPILSAQCSPLGMLGRHGRFEVKCEPMDWLVGERVWIVIDEDTYGESFPAIVTAHLGSGVYTFQSDGAPEEVVLSAKKIPCLIKVSNEFFAMPKADDPVSETTKSADLVEGVDYEVKLSAEDKKITFRGLCYALTFCNAFKRVVTQFSSFR